MLLHKDSASSAGWTSRNLESLKMPLAAPAAPGVPHMWRNVFLTGEGCFLLLASNKTIAVSWACMHKQPPCQLHHHNTKHKVLMQGAVICLTYCHIRCTTHSIWAKQLAAPWLLILHLFMSSEGVVCGWCEATLLMIASHHKLKGHA